MAFLFIPNPPFQAVAGDIWAGKNHAFNFFFHADHFFDYYDWHVKNGELNIISSIHLAFFAQWMMALFFILSGAAVFYSLKSRSCSTFLWERVKRILICLAIDWLLGGSVAD
jgi:hypothetical protein